MAQITERIPPYDLAVLFCTNVTMDESVSIQTGAWLMNIDALRALVGQRRSIRGYDEKRDVTDAR